MQLNTSSMLILLLSLLILVQPSDPKTIVVDETAERRNPTIHIVFKYENGYNLYIFHDRRAFSFCNFTQATLVSKPNSTSFAWHPTRSGFFYFSYNFNNGSLKACKEGEKLPIKVTPLPAADKWALSPEFSPQAAPSPISGGFIPSTPAFKSPFRPHNQHQHEASSPSQAPSASPLTKIPSIVPDTGGGIPFINSNPAVPLPTGQADSATIHSLPTSGQGEGKACRFMLWGSLQFTFLSAALFGLCFKRD